MADHLESVKALATQYRTWAAQSETEDNHVRASVQTGRAKALEATIAELSDARQRLQPIPTTYGDLSDLPPEVLAELNLTKVDELEQQLRDIVAAGDGREVALDPIIIELYRRHHVVLNRRFVMNKLYRMAQKGLIESVGGRKGVYCLSKPMAADEFDNLLDDDDGVPF